MMLRSLVPFVSVSALALLAGCASSASDGAAASTDALTSSSDARVALLRTKLPLLAADAVKAVSDSTRTIALTELVSANCTRGSSLEGIPTTKLDGCTFVFKNGNATTTFAGGVSAYVMLKGDPDPTIPSDPATGEQRPATADKVVPLPGDGLFVSAGAAPRFAAPLALDALGDYVRDVRGAYQVTEVDIDACGDAPGIATVDPVVTKCFSWSDYDGEYTAPFTFATDGGNKAIGLYSGGY